MKVGMWLMILAVISQGCSKARPVDSAGGGGGGQGGQTSLKRMITSKAIPNDLKQIATFYVDYNAALNRSPASLDEFRSYVQRDAPKLCAALDRGEYVVVWKVRDLSSNAVLAYEKEADGEGKRYVVMGDASVHKVDEREFKAALTSQ